MVSTLGELNLRDEYAILEYNAVLADAAKALSPVQHSAVLVRGKKGKGIVGILKMQILLHHLAEGVDPVATPVTSVMQTEVLRLRSNTPLDKAIEIIQERQPHAVIVINDQDTFEGYISAGDYREIKAKILYSNNAGKKIPETIGEAVDLRDEFRIVSVNDTLDSVSLLLRRPSVQFVLAQSSKKGIVGVLSVQHLLRIIAEGGVLRKEKLNKHMKTDILRLRYDTPIDEAIKIVEERRPDAIIVLDNTNSFAGFFSPDDYRSLNQFLPEKIEFDGTFETLVPYIVEKVSKGKKGPIVWQHLDSEIILEPEEIEMIIDENILKLYVPVICDQTDETEVVLKYNLGNETSLDRLSVGDKELETDEVIQEVWSDIFLENFWDIILHWIDATTAANEFASGFGIDKSNSLIRRAERIPVAEVKS